jgi:hypothetical protein
MDGKAIEELVKKEKENEETSCDLSILSGHIVVRIPPEDRHFWSPQLNLSIEKEDDGKTLIRGFYGPNPNTWALFTYGYAVLSILFVFVGIWGMSKLTLNKAAPELWILPILGLLALTLYITAQFGQKLGAEQMYKLHFFYQKVIGEKIKIE